MLLLGVVGRGEMVILLSAAWLPPPSPDAVAVVPADEGAEGAALAPVAVGAHQPVSAVPVPAHTTLKTHDNIRILS